MATKNSPDPTNAPELVEGQGSGSSPLDTTKFNQEIVKKRKPRSKNKKQAEDWELDQAKQKEEEQRGQEDEKYRPLCTAPGIVNTVKVLFEKGILFTTVLDYKLFKIPLKAIPDPICEDQDSSAWSENFINILIDAYGAKEAYTKLKWVAIFGIPITIVTKNHLTGVQAKNKLAITGAIENAK
jgi:hypothetical protein